MEIGDLTLQKIVLRIAYCAKSNAQYGKVDGHFIELKSITKEFITGHRTVLFTKKASI